MNELIRREVTPHAGSAWSGHELPVLSLWRDARARGWIVEVDPHTRAWKVTSPCLAAGASYDPPGPVSTGVVAAFDEYTTFALTGMARACQGVAVLRGYLDWAANNIDQCGCGWRPTDWGSFAASYGGRSAGGDQ